MVSPSPGPQSSPADETEHFQFIDALRGWAFLAVLAVHVQVPMHLPTWVVLVKTAGNYGVQLFFVVSALTLFMSYASRRTRERNPAGAFFVRRFFRIAPLFWLAILLYLWRNGVAPRWNAPTGLGWPQIASTALFLHGWHPSSINSVVPGGWSIAVEMNFYLILPLCFLLITDLRRSLVAAAVLFILSVAISAAAKRFLPRFFPLDQGDCVTIFSYYWFPRQLPIFFLGFVLYFLILGSRASGPARDRRSAGAQALPIAALMIAILGTLTALGDHVPVSYFWYSCAFAGLAYALALRPFVVIVNPATRYVGKVSYSAYITHFLVVGEISRALAEPLSRPLFAHHPAATFLGVYGICLLGTVALSSLTHALVEVPGQNAGRWAIRRLGWGRPSPAPLAGTGPAESPAGAPPAIS